VMLRWTLTSFSLDAFTCCSLGFVFTVKLNLFCLMRFPRVYVLLHMRFGVSLLIKAEHRVWRWRLMKQEFSALIWKGCGGINTVGHVRYGDHTNSVLRRVILWAISSSFRALLRLLEW
jgi:hypothetical protein